jgi:hypothetical protein
VYFLISGIAWERRTVSCLKTFKRLLFLDYGNEIHDFQHCILPWFDTFEPNCFFETFTQLFCGVSEHESHVVVRNIWKAWFSSVRSAIFNTWNMFKADRSCAVEFSKALESFLQWHLLDQLSTLKDIDTRISEQRIRKKSRSDHWPQDLLRIR